jgi:hypothetical protein
MGIITDYRQQWRRDTAANLASDNPTPESGEPVYETDTGLYKIGDGATAYNGLSYQGQSLPTGHITGLETATGTDTEHDIEIAPGKCRSYDDTSDMILNSAITKQIDATWAAGDGAGGLFSGTVAIDTTYHLFLIRKDSDGSIDAGWDTSISAANMPAGYTAYRRIASHITDSSANIVRFTQRSDTFWSYDEYLIYDTTGSGPGAGGLLIDSGAPVGVSVDGQFKLYINRASSNISAWLEADGIFDDGVWQRAVGDTPAIRVIGSAPIDSSGQVRLVTDTAASVDNLEVTLMSYTDHRGRFGGL